jgi:hypothetical protein
VIGYEPCDDLAKVAQYDVASPDHGVHGRPDHHKHTSDVLTAKGRSGGNMVEGERLQPLYFRCRGLVELANVLVVSFVKFSKALSILS